MIRYYIQRQLGRLDLEEIGGAHWDIEKAWKFEERISRADLCCVRRFSDCEQALALANEGVTKEFALKYVRDQRKHRKQAANYVRNVKNLCRKLKN
eukprot:snap_masked-scaffold_10-processed-gene-5.33-mRNA-1 protein AED:1.00 eAED:1.00 QI:0/-1/0/0/-1/1/1/0/95